MATQTEKPGRLQAMGSQRVRHDWARKDGRMHYHDYFIIIGWNTNDVNKNLYSNQSSE